jgi:hypothetical protein
MVRANQLSQGAMLGRPASGKINPMFLFKTMRAVRFLFMGPLILLMLVVINAVTSPGHWWVQWAALGIGIAWFVCLLRVLRLMLVLGGLAALIAYLRKR